MAATATAPAGLLALQMSCRGNAGRERVLRDWMSFLEARGELSRLQRLPTTRRGAPLDWLRLYEEVAARGGFTRVSQRRQWPEVQRVLGGGASVDLLPFQLASHYQRCVARRWRSIDRSVPLSDVLAYRFLHPFEEKQLFGRDVPSPDDGFIPVNINKRGAGAANGAEAIATANELQEAASATGTPLPRALKRVKTENHHGGNAAEFGTLHGLVMALDSGLPAEVHRALNLLTILSFGDPHDNSMATANENELLVDNVPGLLDALYRQLMLCELLPQPSDSPKRRHLLNKSIDIGQREILDARALLILNIMRNLSMIRENEKPMADHDELCVLLIMALRSCFERNPEIGDHILDTLCCLSKRINFLSLHPSGDLQVWHPHHQLSVQLWKKERILPLECLLQQLVHMLKISLSIGSSWGILNKSHFKSRSRPALPSRRSVVLRVCELLNNVCRDVSLKHALSSSVALRDREFLDTVVALLACTRHEFASGKSKNQDTQFGFPIDLDEELDAELTSTNGNNDDDDDIMDETDTEGSRWPAPWENDGLPSGIGMGIVYVTPEGNRHVANEEDARLLDHEIRDAALEILFRLSNCDDEVKVRVSLPHKLQFAD